MRIGKGVTLAKRLHMDITHGCISSVGELWSQLPSCRTELLLSVFVDMWVFKSLIPRPTFKDWSATQTKSVKGVINSGSRCRVREISGPVGNYSVVTAVLDCTSGYLTQVKRYEENNGVISIDLHKPSN